jgi:hypothetical protein
MRIFNRSKRELAGLFFDDALRGGIGIAQFAVHLAAGKAQALDAGGRADFPTPAPRAQIVQRITDAR